MKKRNLITVMMIIFTLALAGCGGSGSGSDDASEREEKVEEKFEKKITDISIDPLNILIPEKQSIYMTMEHLKMRQTVNFIPVLTK